MRKLIFVFSCFITIVGCNNGESGKSIKADPQDTLDIAKQKHIQDDSLAAKYVKSKVIGVWSPVGEDNASFDIGKDSIYYPEQFRSYQYSITDDTFKIKYDGYVVNYRLRMNGEDTLIMTGNEDHYFYRFKN